MPLCLPAQAPEEFFERRIRPLLSKNCYACHTGAESGGLRVDSRTRLLQGGKSGPAVVPGETAKSLLLQAVTWQGKLKMPPSGKLSDEDVTDLTAWVKDGAVWPAAPGDLFTQQVLPVLQKSCWGCHAGSQAPNGLHLDSREALLKGGQRGPAIEVGHPEKSLLLAVLERTHERVKMPPGDPLPAAQIASIAEWVKAGAVWPAGELEPLVAYHPSKEQRAFWSFQPVQATPPPKVRNAAWPRNAIDNFILAKLEEKKLTPAQPASKRVLLRRATYDLTGLPPTPEETAAFLRDASPTAFEKVVDRLLATQAYGERWGRHWLDVVRYADTSGCNSDFPVPSAYRYRNYVIHSFQNDKPYDQFVREQLAGDLIQTTDDEKHREGIVATGYLATARRFGSRNNEFHLTIEDTIDNVGKAFLGLSVSCARCHDHKFDPIPTRDYYSLYGIFNSTKYAFPGTEVFRHTKDFVPLGTPQAGAELTAWEKKLADLDEQYEEIDRQRVRGKLTQQESDAKRAEVRAAVDRIERKPPQVMKAYAVAEGTPGDSRIQHKGEPKNVGPVAPRGFLTILGGAKLPPEEQGSGRRELAQWIATAQNPLTARVMVNRIWEYHFGKGLVATPNDFGIRGERPTHPELLDYLADQFVRSGWSVKALHRQIMLSRAYQMASDNNAANAAIDTQNHFLWRFNRQRLEAEEIRDSMLAIGGTLDTSMAEAHPFPPEYEWRYTQHKQFFAVYPTSHRSVYLMQQRMRKQPFLEVFDGPDPNVTTPVRGNGATALQALYLMNDAFVQEQADLLAVRVGVALGTDSERIQRAFQLVYGRAASPAEIADGVRYLRDAAVELKASATPEDGRRRAALASFMHVLLSSDEFLFVD